MEKVSDKFTQKKQPNIKSDHNFILEDNTLKTANHEKKFHAESYKQNLNQRSKERKVPSNRVSRLASFGG